jgi:hypothetical protein
LTHARGRPRDRPRATKERTRIDPRPGGAEIIDPIASRLFVVYVPGLDRRRVSPDRTPFVDRLLAERPLVDLTTALGTDHLPTLITGVGPGEHRAWGVTLRHEARIAPRPRLGDRLPGIVSTTLQSLRRAVDSSYALSTVPPRRRRQFDVRAAGRLSYGPRGGPRGRALDHLGGFPTVFGVVADSRFLFARRLSSLRRLAGSLPSGQCALEFLEMFALDSIQHWHMHRPRRLDRAYRETDAILAGLDQRATQRGVTFMLLADHGQEPVFGAIPLVRELRATRTPETDYSRFVEPTLARFWIHGEESRPRLTRMLGTVPHARLVTLRELPAHGVTFDDESFGELFLVPDPGWIFFPHDLYQPIQNLFRGLGDPDQRPRSLQPVLRGAHGYLPGHRSERGFVVVADPRMRALRPAAALTDIAPTILRLLGETPPHYMRGTALFA